jgi:hypothetical protein
MPKLDEMAQLSRPFQIGLVAVCVLAAVWLFALQGRSTSTGTSPAVAPASPATAQGAAPTSAAAEAKAAAAPTPVYHGSAPGVEGLTRAINKAHGAVATSQQNAKQLEAKSAQASSEAASNSSPSTSAGASAPAKPVTRPSASTGALTHAPASTSSAAAGVIVRPAPVTPQVGVRVPARQALVERALKQGNIAVILFWNSKGADDVAVQGELRLLEAVHHLVGASARTPQLRRALASSGLELNKKFAAFEASANEVSSFGSITRGIQVQATPTILIVNEQGKTSVLTGLQDAYSIEQAIDEARHA